MRRPMPASADLELIVKSNTDAIELMKKNGVTFEDFPDQKKDGSGAAEFPRCLGREAKGGRPR